MADFVTLLVEMGFSRERAEKAVSSTGNLGVEPAMQWMFDNPEAQPQQPTATLSLSTPAEQKMNTDTTEQSKTDEPTTANAEGESTSEDATVRSYKCEDCGKQFKNVEEMEFHAAKTNHSNFSESNEEKRALTVEEKAEQLKRIEEKLKIKRAEREAKEKLEEIDREKIRMKTGKELAEAKNRLAEQEMKEIADERRREKIEDRMARERVKKQIEADRAARKARDAAEIAKAKGLPPPVEEVVIQPQSPVSSSSTTSADQSEPKKYKETKLQMRLPNGQALVQTFGVNEPLAAVRLYVELHRTDGGSGTFNLMTNFPKKVFVGDEYDIPLDALGLVPSAVLMVTKSL